MRHPPPAPPPPTPIIPEERVSRLDVIEMIGDFITEIDIARGSLMPDDPHRHELDLRRVELDERQRELSQNFFDDNTRAFQAAAQQLSDVDAEILGSIRHVENIQAVLTNINRFLGSVTALIAVVAPFV